MTWQTSYYHYDGLGSTQCLTDENGDVTDQYAYTAYGEDIEAGQPTPTPNPFRYVGREGYYRDADAGDYYVRARVYRPVLIRWLSEDPLHLTNGQMPGGPWHDFRIAVNRGDLSVLVSSDSRALANETGAYRYARNDPLGAGDPSGLLVYPLSPFPASPWDSDWRSDCEKWVAAMPSFRNTSAQLLYPGEAELLDKNCTGEIGLLPPGWKVSAGERGTVECVVGVMTPNVTSSYRHYRPFRPWMEGLIRCAFRHELHHIAQYSYLDPCICVCASTGSALAISHEARKCKDAVECFASAEELKCLWGEYHTALNTKPFDSAYAIRTIRELKWVVEEQMGEIPACLARFAELVKSVTNEFDRLKRLGVNLPNE